MKNKIIILIDENNIGYVDACKYSFKNCEVKSLNENINKLELEELAVDVNSKYEKLVFFDYFNPFYEMLPLISKKVQIYWIITSSIPDLSNDFIYSQFMQIIDYKINNRIKNIGFTDYNFYLVLKNKYNFSHIKLDLICEKKSKNNENSIGLLNYDYLKSSSFYNELSAINMSDVSNVYVLNAIPETINFGNDFDLNIKKISNVYDLIVKNKLNLYINFSSTNIIYFLYSMDNHIICILGNVSFFDNNNNKILKDNLVVNSDDSIDEISIKIKDGLKNEKRIFIEYEKWRKNYSDESKKSVKDFLGK